MLTYEQYVIQIIFHLLYLLIHFTFTIINIIGSYPEYALLDIAGQKRKHSNKSPDQLLSSSSSPLFHTDQRNKKLRPMIEDSISQTSRNGGNSDILNGSFIRSGEKTLKGVVTSVGSTEKQIRNINLNIDNSSISDRGDNIDSQIGGESESNKQNSLVNTSNSLIRKIVIPALFIPLVLPNPRSLAWFPIRNNFRSDDEPVLRYD